MPAGVTQDLIYYKLYSYYSFWTQNKMFRAKYPAIYFLHCCASATPDINFTPLISFICTYQQIH